MQTKSLIMQGTKMEMTIYSGSAYRFRDLENQEGKWVEIFM